MPGPNEKTWRERSGMLGVVMFAILVATVGLASWLTRTRLEPVRRGVEILERIRSRTLHAYWGPEATTRWYLVTDSQGRPTGWWSRTISPTGEGFSGTLVSYREPQKFSIEQWNLANDASSGEYRAAGESSSLVDIVIQLEQGQVRVSRPMARQYRSGSSAAPENYIPEGMTSLALSEAVKAGKPAYFQIILNNLAIMGEEINFALVRVTPGERGLVRVEYEVLGPRGMHKNVQLYQLDPQGNIASIKDEADDADQTTQTHVSPEEVFQHFPEAAKFMSPSAQPARALQGEGEFTAQRTESSSLEAPRLVG